MEIQAEYKVATATATVSRACVCGSLMGIEIERDGLVYLLMAGNLIRRVNMIHRCGARFDWTPPRETDLPEFVAKRKAKEER